MNDKITKQHIYSEMAIRLDKLEYKLDKLLALMESKTVNNVSVTVTGDCNIEGVLTESSETIKGPPKPFIQIQDSEQFDEAYK